MDDIKIIQEPLPLISVLMPVYNAARFLQSAIESILNQSEKRFELIIIDDGSTDDSVKIIQSFNDNRIVYIKNPQNIGIVRSLNYGMSIAKGKYIARMDGDDIALPLRFEKQLDLLENNLDIGICGTNAITIDALGNKKRLWFYESNKDIVEMAPVFVCPFLHPTIMIRRNILESIHGYTSGMEPSEDFECWIRILSDVKGTNLQEPLLYYRIDAGSFSERMKDKAFLKLQEVFTLHKERLCTDIENIDFHARSVYGDWNSFEKNDFTRLRKWLKNIQKNNSISGQYDVALFKKISSKYLVNIYLKLITQNTGIIRFFALLHAIFLSPKSFLKLLKRKMKSEKIAM